MVKKVLTVPNIISLCRIGLIPIMAYLYLGKENNLLTLLVLVLSGLSDIADGFIARRFNMISNLGKILDPIADKLTQIVMLICVSLKYPQLTLLAYVLLVKEVLSGLRGLLTVKKTGVVEGAMWHGKAATLLLYLTLGVHIIWQKVPLFITLGLVILSLCLMVISFILYAGRDIKALRKRSL